MLRTFPCASGFDIGPPPTSPAGRPALPIAFRRAVAALRTIREAWRECMAAHRQYGQLTSRGIPHETAVREALGFGPAPAPETRETAQPLDFAGKA